MNQDLLTIDELAAKLKVKKSWVYGQTRQKGPGTIPRLSVGKYLRFDYQAVMDWLQRQNQDN